MPKLSLFLREPTEKLVSVKHLWPQCEFQKYGQLWFADNCNITLEQSSLLQFNLKYRIASEHTEIKQNDNNERD